MSIALKLPAPWGGIWELKPVPGDAMRKLRVVPRVMRAIDDILKRIELWFFEEPVGEAGTEMECGPPCFAIKDYTDSFFDFTSCTCDSVTTQDDYWDGMWHQFRQHNSGDLLPGQKRYERVCRWEPRLNDGDFPDADRISDKVFYTHSDPTLTTRLEPTEDEEQWEMVIKCTNGAGSSVIWQGKSKNRDPLSVYTKDSGCDDSANTTITLEKASAHGCFCKGQVACPSVAADCADWPDTLYGTITGNAGDTDCTDRNGCRTYTKTSGCEYSGGGFPEPGSIVCSVLGRILPAINPGYWVFETWLSGYAVMGSVGDAEPTFGTYKIHNPCSDCGDSATFTFNDTPC